MLNSMLTTKYIGQGKTNSNGLAILNYKVTNTGNLQVKYSFEENENYLSFINKLHICSKN
ncbi:hypothetical protein ALNOE001_15020 [Candidatus Methanobinarius endosymbioticus]|uniref:Uncharacterized protein n=1 Tax=Candidatus Methanobinarius endosymbioticus TaxID=2006182 RepID=A0A366MB98_9EURY|nr:hypothetical protein ALNOE001_15020 [Candidatus Methanobinarius endosymbioticus]